MLFKNLFNNLAIKSYILYFFLSAIIIMILIISFMNRNYLEIDNVFIQSIIIIFFSTFFLLLFQRHLLIFSLKKTI